MAKRGCISALKVGAPASVDEQCITGEDREHPIVVDQVAVMMVRMSGSEERLESQGSDCERPVFRDSDIGAGRAAHVRIGD